jgi:hypothetical protein
MLQKVQRVGFLREEYVVSDSNELRITGYETFPVTSKIDPSASGCNLFGRGKTQEFTRQIPGFNLV